MNIGYIRVSSCGQRTDRQLEGVALDRVFMDKTSGKNMDRPEFQACLRALRAGDMLHVHSIDRLTRSLQDLLSILEDMADRNVTVKFYKENLVFGGRARPSSACICESSAAVAEFERALIRERQREGIALAKQRGKYKGSKKRHYRRRDHPAGNTGHQKQGEHLGAGPGVRHLAPDSLPLPAIRTLPELILYSRGVA